MNDSRLTLVVAPAGFGKTTAIVQGLARLQRRTAWVSLDAHDDALPVFARYVIAAMQQLDPVFGRDALDLLRAGGSPAPLQTAALLVNSLYGQDESLTLVIDDYHVISDDAVHEFMIGLVEHLPPRIHIVIVTRHDPPFPARWRARGWMHEVRGDALRFSAGDAAAYLNGRLALALTESQIAHLVEQTEGWIAGLHLAALALGPTSQRQGSIRQFSGSAPFVFGYLVEEVLHSQPGDIQKFLMQTAVLGRMNAELCDGLTGRSDSADVLEHLLRLNLFVTSLGEGWYRYHPLFADVLRALVPVDAQRALHARAADLLRDMGQAEAAVRHYLLAADEHEAAQCAADQVLPMLHSGDLLLLQSLLAQLPSSALHHPLLLLAKGWLAAHAHRLWDASACLNQIDTRQIDAEAGAWVQIAHGLTAFYDGRMPDVLAHIEAARMLSQSSSVSGMFCWLRGVALWEHGESEQALDSLRAALRTPEIDNDPFGCAGISYFLADNLHQMGRRAEALAICERVMAQLVDADDTPLVHAAPVTAQAGILHYEANELDTATYLLRLGLRLAEPLALTRGLVIGRVYLAQIAFALGDQDAALRLLYDARYVASAADSPPFIWVVDAIESWLMLRAGTPEPMERWLNTFPLDHARVPFPVHMAALRGMADLGDARVLDLLERLETDARQRGLHRRLIPLLLVRARLHDRSGDDRAAQVVLGQALAYAVPGGYRRDFLDAHPRILALLHSVRGHAPAFVDSLTGGHSAVPRVGHAASLPDALTERELEVMRLAAEGWSNREIAAHMVVAVSTVKTHIKHAFSKLDADSRTRAVARARALGLIHSA
jgi:LuxR family transcriptional regulator, maltose regulon positive regulatory protein